MTFLPEDDQLFLQSKQFTYELKSEVVPPMGERRGVIFSDFRFSGNLFRPTSDGPVPCPQCDLLILIPPGYATTRLDSFHTYPRLKRPDGTDPDGASGEQEMFGEKWQFWSRHLDKTQWRPGVDGLETFLSWVREALRTA